MTSLLDRVTLLDRVRGTSAARFRGALTSDELLAAAEDKALLADLAERLTQMTNMAVQQTYVVAQQAGEISWQVQAFCAAELKRRIPPQTGGRARRDHDGSGRTATFKQVAKECGIAVSTLQRAAQVGELLSKTPLNIQKSLESKTFYELALRSGQPEALLADFAKEKTLHPGFSLRDAKRMGDKVLNKVEWAKREVQASKLPICPFLIQGDCRQPRPEVLPVKSVNLLLTDPPYGIATDGSYRTHSAPYPVIAGDHTPEEACLLLVDMLAAVDSAMADDCHLLVFTSWTNAPLFDEMIRQAGYKVGEKVIWNKGGGAAGDTDDFARTTELIIHATRGKAIIRPRIGHVLCIPPQHDTGHPFQKPLALLKKLIEVTTGPGELVLDPFCGAAPTVVAALSLGRRAVGIESDPDFYNLACINLDRHREGTAFTGDCSVPQNFQSDRVPALKCPNGGGRQAMRFDMITLPAEPVPAFLSR